MRQLICDYYSCDFETTTHYETGKTDVWLSGFEQLYTGKFKWWTNIYDFIEYFLKKKKSILYFHNLGFDGTFIVDFLLKSGYKHELPDFRKKRLGEGVFTTIITEKNLWYSIKIGTENHDIEIRDSAKLFPMSIRELGKVFGDVQKGDIDYSLHNGPDEEVTEEELDYFWRDVHIEREAIELMLEHMGGDSKLTIGANAMCKYKHIFNKTSPYEYSDFFPNLYDITHGTSTIGDEIRKSYKGGWTYVSEEKKGKIIEDGVTIDVNGLYSYEMHSMSGNYYPVGIPKIMYHMPESKNCFVFVKFKTHFDLREGYLPFIQIKGTGLYNGREHLKTNRIGGKRTIERICGEIIDLKTEFVMTKREFDLFKKHYVLDELEIIEYYVFVQVKGLFDKYIDIYSKLKAESSGGMRLVYKRFLNSLYGKFATAKENYYKEPYLNEDGVVKFKLVKEKDKAAGYIPIGSAIVSNARCHTVSVAQKLYNGAGNGFCYSDTDSIHADVSMEEIINLGIKIDDKELGAWAHECSWSKGYFVRPKTYIEVVNNKHNITCAGMTSVCKAITQIRLGDMLDHEEPDVKKAIELIENNNYKPIKIQDFKKGYEVVGKLRKKNIYGGQVLIPTTFKIK